MQRARLDLLVFALAVLPCSFALADDASIASLPAAMRSLTGHVNETSRLTADQISQQAEIIADNVELLGQTRETVREAFALAACYEARVGPLFMNEAICRGTRRRIV
jgi:hypothetical protein